MMFGEPWDTILLALFAAVGILAGAFTQDWLADRAAERRKRDAASHAAE